MGGAEWRRVGLVERWRPRERGGEEVERLGWGAERSTEEGREGGR